MSIGSSCRLAGNVSSAIPQLELCESSLHCLLRTGKLLPINGMRGVQGAAFLIARQLQSALVRFSTRTIQHSLSGTKSHIWNKMLFTYHWSLSLTPISGSLSLCYLFTFAVLIRLCCRKQIKVCKLLTTVELSLFPGLVLRTPSRFITHVTYLLVVCFLGL